MLNSAVQMLLTSTNNQDQQISNASVNKEKIISNFNNEKEKVCSALEKINDTVLLQAISNTSQTLNKNRVIKDNPQTLIQALSGFTTEKSVAILYILKDLPSDIQEKKDFQQFVYGFKQCSSLSICLTNLIIKTFDNETWTKEKIKTVSFGIDDVLLDKDIEQRNFFEFMDYLLNQINRTHMDELLDYLRKYQISLFSLFPKTEDSMFKLSSNWNDGNNQGRLERVAEILALKILDKIKNSKPLKNENNSLKKILEKKIDELRLSSLKPHSLEEDSEIDEFISALTQYKISNSEIRDNENKKNKPNFITNLINKFSCQDQPFKKIIIGLCFSRLLKNDSDRVLNNLHNKFFKKIDPNNEFEAQTIMNIFTSLESLNFNLDCIKSICKNIFKIENALGLNSNESIKTHSKEQEFSKSSFFSMEFRNNNSFLKNNDISNKYKREFLAKALCCVENETPIVDEDQKFQMSDIIADELCNLKHKPTFSNEILNTIIETFGNLRRQKNKNSSGSQQKEEKFLINKIYSFSLFINKFNFFLIINYERCKKNFKGKIERWVDKWGENDKYYFTENDMLSFLRFIATFEENRVTQEILSRLEKTIACSVYPISPQICFKLLEVIIDCNHISEVVFLQRVKNYLDNEIYTLEDLVNSIKNSNGTFHLSPSYNNSELKKEQVGVKFFSVIEIIPTYNDNGNDDRKPVYSDDISLN